MAVRTAYAGTAAANDVYTAANHAKMPGGWIGYASVTADQNSITTVTDLTGLTVTVTVGTNRLIRISAHVNSLMVSTSGATRGNCTVSIKESSTTLGSELWTTEVPASGGTSQKALRPIAVVVAPSAGSHTYKLTQEATGTNVVSGLDAAAGRESYIVVEDLGPSS